MTLGQSKINKNNNDIYDTFEQLERVTFSKSFTSRRVHIIASWLGGIGPPAVAFIEATYLPSTETSPLIE